MQYTIYCMPVPKESVATTKALLSDEAYWHIRDAIVTGVIAPGERLREAELEHWLGISRTPIREALLRLQHARLVSVEPGRSTTVMPLDSQIARQTHAIVGAIFVLAANEAARSRTDEDVAEARAATERFTKAVEQAEKTSVFAAVTDLEQTMLRAGHNEVGSCVVAMFGPLLRREQYARFDVEVARDLVPLVTQVVEALASGDVATCRTAARHLWAKAPTGSELRSGGFGLD